MNAVEFQKREKSLIAGVTKEGSPEETGLRLAYRWVDFAKHKNQYEPISISIRWDVTV